MYEYETERPRIFTDEGIQTLLGIRDNIDRLLEDAGAVKLWNAVKGHGSSSWMQLACIDYLVEIGHIREVPTTSATDNKVFVSTKDSEFF